MSNRNVLLLEPYEGNEPYAFISYRSSERDRAKELKTQLHVAGYRVWFDNGIAPGEEWARILQDKIRNCTVMIVLISNAYMESEWCRKELKDAKEMHKSILAIYLEDVHLTDEFEELLHDIQNLQDYGRMSLKVFYSQMSRYKELQQCKGKPTRLSRIAVDDRIDTTRQSGIHCILTLDMMEGMGSYTDTLSETVRNCIRTQDEISDVIRFTLDAGPLPHEDKLRSIQSENPRMRAEYVGGRIMSVALNRYPMPEDDPDARTEYLKDLCDLVSDVFQALIANGVTELHMFFRGPLAALAFIGQAAGSDFTLYYYMLYRNINRTAQAEGCSEITVPRYYRVGTQTTIS